MKRNRNKDLVIDMLRKTPIIQIACEKVGIARATFYRWKKEDEKFSKATDEAIAEGEELINDVSESQLISLIKEKNFSAIRFWLNHRSARFRDSLDINAKINNQQEELTPEQEAVVKEALRLASIIGDEPPTHSNNTNHQKND